MAALTTNFADVGAPARIAPRPAQGLFARFIASVQDARMRQAERQIGWLIESKGGKLTDDIERQIERSFL